MTLMQLLLCSLFFASSLAFAPRTNFTSIGIENVLSLTIGSREFLKLGRDEQVAILNEFADKLFEGANDYILQQGLDPVPLVDLHEEFQWTIFFGQMYLKNGFLQGLATLGHKGDVTITYEYPNVQMHLPLTFGDMKLQYDYAIQVWTIGPEGVLKGSLDGCKYTIDLNLDMTTLRASLENFKLNRLGKLSLEFDGGFLEEIANILIDILIPILKPIIRIILDGFLGDALNSVISIYNSILELILGLPSP